MKTHRDFIKSSALYAIANLFEQVCGMMAGFCVAKMLGPRVQGIWQTARLFRMYSDLSTLGHGFGMRREVAVAVGAGNRREIEDQRDTGFVWNGGCMLVAALAVGAFGLAPSLAPLLRQSLLAVAAVLAFTGFSTFFSFWYKTVERFGVLSVVAVLGGMVSLLTVWLVSRFGFGGVLTGYVLAAVVVLAVQAAAFGEKVKLRFRADAWKRSLCIGFPLWLGMISGLVFTSLDRILVVGLMGFTDMGFYSVATMCFMPVSMAVSSVSVVLLPRVCRHYGQTGTSEQMSQFLAEPLRLLMTPLAGVAGLAALIIPWIVEALLPGYEAGIVPAQIVLLGLPFGCVTGFFENVLVASGLTWRMALVTTLASVAKLVLVLALLVCGMGLPGVALGSVLASMIGFALLLVVAGRATGMAWKLRMSLLLESLAATGLTAAVVFYLRDIRGLLQSPVKSASSWVACGLLVALPACVVLRRLRRSLRNSRI